MNIWLFNASEFHAFAGNGQRSARCTMQARALVARGHNVHWFSSSFDHFSKSFRSRESVEAALSEGIKLHLLPAHGYKRNLSIQRLRDHAYLGRRLESFISNMKAPDLVLSSYPIIDFASIASRYGTSCNIPVVIDVRDMWPDIFEYGVPTILKPIAKPLFSLYRRQGRKALADATAICGITDEFVDWAVAMAGRLRQATDRAFPLCFHRQAYKDYEISDAEKFWQNFGVPLNSKRPLFVFLGTLGNSLDVEPLLNAAMRFEDCENGPYFVFCGEGDRLKKYRQMTARSQNIFLPGWVNGAQGYTLMRYARAGLNPLPHRPDFLASINGKTSEYLAAGLPIVSSPKEGAVYRLLREHSCGVSYDPSNVDEAEFVLRGLLENLEACKSMSKAASRLFSEKFVAETVFKEMAIYLEQIVEDTVSVRQISKK